MSETEQPGRDGVCICHHPFAMHHGLTPWCSGCGCRVFRERSAWLETTKVRPAAPSEPQAEAQQDGRSPDEW